MKFVIGLRLHSNYMKDHCKALAVLSTYRNACVGINLGGSHGGIKVDPSVYNKSELRDVVQTYTRELSKRNFCGK